MLETIREFGRERLGESGREAAIRQPDDEDDSPLQPFGLMDRRQDNLLVFRADNRHVFASEGVRQRDLLQKRIHVFIAQGILRELLEVIEACLRVGELRSGVIGIAFLDNEPDGLRRVPPHPLRVERAEN